MESPEAAFIPFVDQLLRVRGAVKKGGQPPDIPLQGCVDQPLHLRISVGLADGVEMRERAATGTEQRE